MQPRTQHHMALHALERQGGSEVRGDDRAMMASNHREAMHVQREEEQAGVCMREGRSEGRDGTRATQEA
jgi:hypothetical protein